MILAMPTYPWKNLKEKRQRSRWDAFWKNEGDVDPRIIAEAIILTVIEYPDFAMGWAENFFHLQRDPEVSSYEHRLVNAIAAPVNGANRFDDPRDLKE